MERRESVPAPLDLKLVSDDELLRRLLQAESRDLPTQDYFRLTQTEVKEHMRFTLTEWMRDVCQDEQCERDVFPLSCRYLDRFLSSVTVHASQLQVLGSACMFAASKVRQMMPLRASRLVHNSAGAFTMGELISWEMLLLNRLRWDVSGVTPLDFLPILCHRLGLNIDLVKTRFSYFLDQLCLDHRLASLPSSSIAVGCLVTVVRQRAGPTSEDACYTEDGCVALLINSEGDRELLRQYISTIVDVLERGECPSPALTVSGQSSQTGKCPPEQQPAAGGHSGSSSGVKHGDSRDFTTPTDVRDAAQIA